MSKNARNTTPQLAIDPDEAPVWSAEVFKRAQISKGDQVLREATGTLKRGRPKLEAPKEQVSIRLDQDVLAWFRSQGPGWQSQINDILKKVVEA